MCAFGLRQRALELSAGSSCRWLRTLFERVKRRDQDRILVVGHLVAQFFPFSNPFLLPNRHVLPVVPSQFHLKVQLLLPSAVQSRDQGFRAFRGLVNSLVFVAQPDLTARIGCPDWLESTFDRVVWGQTSLARGFAFCEDGLSFFGREDNNHSAWPTDHQDGQQRRRRRGYRRDTLLNVSTNSFSTFVFIIVSWVGCKSQHCGETTSKQQHWDVVSASQ